MGSSDKSKGIEEMTWFGHWVNSEHMAGSLGQVDKTLYNKKVAFTEPPGLEQCPYLHWRDTQSEAPENAGKAYLDPALNKTDHRVLSSSPPSNPSWPCSPHCIPISFHLSLTSPALCPSAGLIFSRVLLGPPFPPACNLCRKDQKTRERGWLQQGAVGR